MRENLEPQKFENLFYGSNYGSAFEGNYLCCNSILYYTVYSIAVHIIIDVILTTVLFIYSFIIIILFILFTL